MSRLSIDEKIEQLEQLDFGNDPEVSKTTIQAALKAKQNRLVSKAAKLCVEHHLYEYFEELKAAFHYFAEKPEKDKGCFAKKSIVKTLYELDCLDDDFYTAAIALRQHEPVWGGHVDSAVEVRCWSAYGLTLSANSRIVFPLIELLHDEEPQARLGAVKAISHVNPSTAELLLREKVLDGDEDAYVVGECFDQLMSIEPECSLEFVAGYLQHDHDEVREYAALALAHCSDPQAFDALKSAFEEYSFGRQGGKLIEAMALHRSQKAMDYLLDRLTDADIGLATDIIRSLSVYKSNESLRARMLTIISELSDNRLESVFEEYW
ncbi:MAG: HEAT repeat domain-containing protein [Candidatus Thiodiazotropha sp.]